jgi:hypothetical protein
VWVLAGSPTGFTLKGKLVTVIGVDLDPDILVLVKNRDFKWTFDNVDVKDQPQNFPAGRLFFELQTGGAASCQQTLEVDGANGGTWKLGAAVLPFNAKASAVKAAVESVVGVGAGNVAVTATYTPQWVYTGNITGVTVTQNQQDGINLAVNKLFDAVQGITGTDIHFTYNNPGFVITVTAKSSMDEATLAGWVVNTFNVNVQNAIAGILGATHVSAVAEFYVPKRLYALDFGNKLVNQPVAVLAPDVSALTGHLPSVTPVVVQAGVTGITNWDFTISGSRAVLKVESEDVAKIPARTHWQLVWMPDGEPAGGDPVARGVVKIEG